MKEYEKKSFLNVARSVPRRWVIVLVSAVFSVSFIVFFTEPVYRRFLEKDWSRETRNLRDNVESYEKMARSAERDLKSDMEGGDVPEETLALFIDALRREDIHDAVSYMYSPPGRPGSPWFSLLQELKGKGKLETMVSYLERAEPVGSSVRGYFGFEVRDKNGILEGDIEMILNSYSGIWKVFDL